MVFNLDNNAIISFLVCIICLFVFGKIFILPLKSILKLIANSCIGAAIIYIINLIGANFGFYIGINLGTAIFVGIWEFHGAILLVILRLFVIHC